MFVVELAFDSNPARLELRPAHREKLKVLRDKGIVRMAGPFADESGALLIFDVPDEKTLEQVMDDDPYYRAPGVRIVRCKEWTAIAG
ncbi:MAG: YciI family protein [Stackebrandtia sp.]